MLAGWNEEQRLRVTIALVKLGRSSARPPSSPHTYVIVMLCYVMVCDMGWV